MAMQAMWRECEDMTDILRLRHEVRGGYKGCCRCPKRFLPYYVGSDGHWYCEDCGQELVKKKTATFGVLGDPDFNFNFKHPRCLFLTAPPAESVEEALECLEGFGIRLAVEAKSTATKSLRARQCEIRSKAIFTVLDAFKTLESEREQYATKHLERQTPAIISRFVKEVEKEIIEHLEAENALLKKKLAIALRGLDEYGHSNNWGSAVADLGRDWWVGGNGYELARRIKAEIEEVK